VCSFDNGLKIRGMPRFAMVFALIHRVGQIDGDIYDISYVEVSERRS
jgi:hypothetical protein